MIDSKSTSGGRRLWVASIPFAVLAVLALIALVVSAFGASQYRGLSTLLAILGTLLGLPLLILLMLLPILGPQLSRNRRLRHRFPTATVLTSQKAAGLDEALAALGFIPRPITHADAAPQFFGVVLDEHEVSLWFGTREPVKVAQFARASISNAVVAKRERYSGLSWALVLHFASDGEAVEVPLMPRFRGWFGAFPMSRASLERLAHSLTEDSDERPSLSR
ncbi:hypothetical protein [Leifsonia sp. C5G2]|uniref:hypothetical protein n=1 Tax=Leifsonia sp. C5G2 TaxID=2735269 RepID=UPI001584FE28|nr:hypothetical protein [Leifsonia sp. C5G2]NUU06440.1 hypothetical protein [Leifsonia sp. C5G2]